MRAAWSRTVENMQRGLARTPLASTTLVASPRQALALAEKWHGDQRYGPFPYGYHLRATIAAAKELGFGGRKERTVAALHDAIEDTGLTRNMIEARFGSEIANAVDQLTRRADVPLPAYFAGMGDLAFSVKLADRLANLRMNGTHISGPEDLERQVKRIVPKYVAEQSLLEARAQGNPRFEEACRALRVELAAAQQRVLALSRGEAATWMGEA